MLNHIILCHPYLYHTFSPIPAANKSNHFDMKMSGEQFTDQVNDFNENHSLNVVNVKQYPVLR
jgi:hypothetical protein